MSPVLAPLIDRLRRLTIRTADDRYACRVARDVRTSLICNPNSKDILGRVRNEFATLALLYDLRARTDWRTRRTRSVVDTVGFDELRPG